MKRRILVAEDDAELRAAVSEFLLGEGFDVVEADNGATALEAARTDMPDVRLNSIPVVPVSASPRLAEIARRYEVRASLAKNHATWMCCARSLNNCLPIRSLRPSASRLVNYSWVKAKGRTTAGRAWGGRVDAHAGSALALDRGLHHHATGAGVHAAGVTDIKAPNDAAAATQVWARMGGHVCGVISE